jgi:MoaA/NifB/PqqE/SkfB family radical SAM enzyme
MFLQFYLQLSRFVSSKRALLKNLGRCAIILLKKGGTDMYSRVYIEITNICNMACSFCHGHHRPNRQMTEGEYAHILRQLEGKTQYIYHHLMGEPLVHPGLPRFIEMAVQAGFKPMITTNGTLLPTRGDALLGKGLHKINISLHSFEGTTPQSHSHYLEGITKFAEKATADGTIVSLRLWNSGCDEGRNDTALDFLRQMLPGQWAENSRGYRIREKLFLEWGDRFAWPDLNAPDNGPRVSCYGLRDHFGILCDGTVVPCCLDSEGTITLGNVFRENLMDILASPRAGAMAEGFRCRKATEELCRRCGYAQKF